MPYFIRVSDTNSIEGDIARGFSSYMGSFDMEDAAMMCNLDFDNLDEAELVEELESQDWFQGTDGMFRQFHHDGLSCHLITDSDELCHEAIQNTVEKLGINLGHGFSHEAMMTNIQWVASINKTTHIFFAEEYN